MKNARREYAAALADFSKPGARWETKGRLTYWGKAAGLTAEEIVEDAHARGVKGRDADIRRGWRDAQPQGDGTPCGETPGRPLGWDDPLPLGADPQPRPSPRRPARTARTFPRYVRSMIEAGGGAIDAATGETHELPDDLRDGLRMLSPCEVPAAGEAQTRLFLEALWDPGDLLFVHGKKEKAAPPGFRVNFMTCREWLAEGLVGLGGRSLVNPNPFTGAEGETTGGTPSYTAKACIARFPYVEIEFDHLALAAQGAFWRGLLTSSPLGMRVASLVYSGGKSIHGLLYVGCGALAGWEEARDRLQSFLAADEERHADAGGQDVYPFRADEAGLRNPLQATRLAGARRDGGTAQELLYLNPGARRR